MKYNFSPSFVRAALSSSKPTRNLGLARTLVSCAALLLAVAPLQAGNTWDGGGGSGNWSDSLNWNLDTLPTSPGGLTFAGTLQLASHNDQFANGTLFNGLNFSVGAGAFVLDGNSISLGANVVNSSTSLQTINFGLDLTGTRTFALTTGGGNITVGGNITSSGGTFGVSTSGAGFLTLSGANTYSGNTTFAGGQTININSANAIGTGALVAGGNGSFDNTSGAAITLTNNNAFILSGGSPVFTGTNDLNLGTGAVTLSVASRTITVTNAGATLTLGGVVGQDASPRGLTKAGAGTLVLSSANTFSGGLTLTSGTLSAGNDGSLGTGTFALSGGTLQAVGGSRTFANAVNFAANSTIAGSQAVTFNGLVSGNATGTNAITVNNSALTTFAGGVAIRAAGTGNRDFGVSGSGVTLINSAITSGTNDNTVNPSNLAYRGTGTLILSATNTYNGTTSVVAGGTLLVNGTNGSSGAAAAPPSAAYTVNGTLGGTGTIDPSSVSTTRTFTVSNTGTLAPGDSTLALAGQTGTLDINAPISLATGSKYVLQLGGTTPGDGTGFYDQTNMTLATGSLSIATGATGATLSISLVNNFTPGTTDIFYVLTRADAAATASFAGLAEGATVTAGGYNGQITYLANWTGTQAGSSLTGGNDVALYNLTAVPEPSTWATMIGGVVLLVGLQRFRRKSSS
ncbi:MAG: autotransporter-associated beta strand repeat-containing protein [Chthoniobacterales bacterium]|nr:autotransporter-associated beta strand repeat-containing protein [Chthoniobacterales bacterium]